jgi:hypothetical protein
MSARARKMAVKGKRAAERPAGAEETAAEPEEEAAADTPIPETSTDD